MRQFIAATLILLVLIWSVPAVAAEELQIEAEAAVVLDGETGRVLWAKNPHLPLPPASTTKIMTILLGLELGKRKRWLRFPSWPPPKRSRVYLGAGKNTPKGIALCRAAGFGQRRCRGRGRAPGRLREDCPPDEPEAQELGALNTNFVNPNGLPDQHRTSAYDLALIARKALEYQSIGKWSQPNATPCPGQGTRRAPALEPEQTPGDL